MRHLNSPITLTNRRRRTQLNGPREWFDGHGHGHSGEPKGNGRMQGNWMGIMLIMQTPSTD